MIEQDHVFSIPTKACPRCQKRIMIKITLRGFQAWAAGKPLQMALPYLTQKERRWFIEGYHEDCPLKEDA